MDTKSIHRRDFLKGSGALIVGFSLFGPAARVLSQSNPDLDAGPDPTSLDTWLAIGSDGSVTVFTSKVELGTGVETALAQIVAEELDVAFDKIKMDTGDTAKTIDQATTAASRTVERGGPQLRQAAAAARLELLKLAAARLDAPVDRLTVTDGVVSLTGNPSDKVSYGELVGGRRFNVHITATGAGWDMKLAPEVPHKDPKEYRIVGTSVARMDLPPKFTGEFTYSQDVRLPGMLHGRVVRPPVVNSKPASVDESSIKDIPGVVEVVQEGNFVGVVAKTEWAAIQAARALKVTWSTPATKLPGTPDQLKAYLKDTKSFRDVPGATRGDIHSGFAQAAKTFEATFYWPFQLHGMLGPSCAVADVQSGKATIWTGSQGVFRTREEVAQLLGLPEKNVHVLYREGAGCYGRLSPDDVPQDAAVMSRAVGKPVRVQWSRADEHGWEPKGPAQLMSVRAGVDAQGKIVAWDFLDRSFPWTEVQGNPLLAAKQVGIKSTGPGQANGAGAGGEIYAFENIKVVAAQIPWVSEDPNPLRTSNLRAPGELARCFASESLIDEIAASQGTDPVEFRLRYLTHDKRPPEILLAATNKADWKNLPSGASAGGSVLTGKGVAVANRANTITCAVAEIQIDKSSGKITVKRITLAQDCGLIVNPDGVKNQIEGNVIQGVSRTLLEEVVFDASGVKNLDWRSYPIITFEDVPEIEVVLINRPEMPSLGSGEPSIVPVPAAIANAFANATGVRPREIPLTKQRVLAALNGSPARERRA